MPAKITRFKKDAPELLVALKGCYERLDELDTLCVTGIHHNKYSQQIAELEKRLKALGVTDNELKQAKLSSK